MRKYASLGGGFTLLLGNGSLAKLFPEQIEQFISLMCIVAGALLITCFVYELRKELYENNKELMQHIDEIADNEKNLLLEENAKILDKYEQMIMHMCMKQEEMLGANITELKEVIVSQQDKAIKGVVENNIELIHHIDKISENNKELMQHIDNISVNVQNMVLEENIKIMKKYDVMTNRLYEIMCELSDKVLENSEVSKSTIHQLCEELDNKNSLFVSKMSKHMLEIVNEIEDYDSKMSEQIGVLAGQYAEFEKFSNEIIKKMSLMSDKDYEMLKELLDAK